MACEQIREILSAALDGEDRPGERTEADAHLAGCAACRQWLHDAAAVTRRIRLGVALPDPVLPDLVLPDPVLPDPILPDRVLPDPVPPDIAAAATPGRARRRVVAGLRMLLGLLG